MTNRRFTVRPADAVYPGDRISTNQQAIDAVNGNRAADAAVDWDAVERGAALVRHRRRTTPTRIRFTTAHGAIRRGVAEDVLVVGERADGNPLTPPGQTTPPTQP